MRILLFLGACLFLAPLSFVSAQVVPGDPGNFITTWDTTEPGVSESNQVMITGRDEVYNYDLYWESLADNGVNGFVEDVTSDSYLLTFPEEGQYRVEISGAFPRIYFGDSSDSNKLLTVEQWGDIVWTDMSFAFYQAKNLRIPATDAPDLSQVTNMSYMFYGTAVFNDSINHWDVSNVISMAGMFRSARDFNQPLNEWDVSSVLDMSAMFGDCHDYGWGNAFNQPLNEWDVSNVQNMANMFCVAKDFNQPLNEWDVSSVTDMSGLFREAYSFNQPLDNWDVSNVTSFDMTFEQAYNFNQPLNEWDVSSVTNMSSMFGYANAFNQPLNEWDVSNVTNINSMFTNGYSFNQPLDNWDVSNVTNMSNLFSGALAFNQPLNSWNISNVIDTSGMFSETTTFNQPLDNWDMSKVTTISYMFANARAFDQDISMWDISSVTDDPFSWVRGADRTFEGSLFSTINQDAFLQSWAKHAVINNITSMEDFHIGVRNYSGAGEAAIEALRGLGWSVAEQLQARYTVQNGSLVGTGHQWPLMSGDTTESVEVIPDTGCTFVGWSDGITDTVRQDIIAEDNLFVSATIDCPESGGGGKTSTATRFNTTTTPTAMTMTKTLAQVQAIIDNPMVPTDADTVKQLIALLMELVATLTQLLILQGGGGEV